MIQSHRLYTCCGKEFQKNAPSATNIQHWTAACKMLYKALFNPADQIFTAAEFVKTDRLHRPLQSHERVRLAPRVAASISQRPAAHLARSSPACARQLVKLYYKSCICIAPNMGAMHNGRPGQRKFDASQGNSAAQLATTMVLG